MTLTPEAQCAANVKAWMANHGLYLAFTTVLPDRVFMPRDLAFEVRLSEMCAAGVIENRFAGNHGKYVQVAYRECVSRCAAQIVVHDHAIEFDFDFWQPWDVVGGVGHLWEVLRNKLGHRKTDPFEIAEGLKSRGIYAETAA